MLLNKLTEYQKSILKEMEIDGVFLYTNEGKDYKCWLQYKDGTKKTVRKDSCNLLFELGYIKEKEGISDYYFVYIRTVKKVK